MKKEIFHKKFQQLICKRNRRAAGKSIIILLLSYSLIGGFTRSVESVFAVSEIDCLSAPLTLNLLVFESAVQRYYAEQSEAVFQEVLLRRITPGLNQLISVLDEYQSERIISRYYLTGSFLRGKIREDQDIDLAVSFRRYDNPEVLRRLLDTAADISSRAGFTFHITLQAFGFEYELQSGRIIYTGDIRSENIVARSVYPEEQSLLRIDNLTTAKYAEDFWINLSRQCRDFNFSNMNLIHYQKDKSRAIIAGREDSSQALFPETIIHNPHFPIVGEHELYSIGKKDFIDGTMTGYWPVNIPMKDIFQWCTCVVFVDGQGSVSLAHIEVDSKSPIVMEDVLAEWKEYAAIDENGDFLPAFDAKKIFTAETRVLIISRHAYSNIAGMIKEFLGDKGVSTENVQIASVPTDTPVDAVGLFFWPKEKQLEVSFAVKTADQKYVISGVRQYDLAPRSENVVIAASAENKDLYDLKKIKDSILYNSLIQKFFTLSAKDSVRKMPWSLVLYKLLEPDSDFMKEVIEQVEAKGEAWISQQGEIIRETHSSRSSYTDTDTGGSWTTFIDKTKYFDAYNLAHLLAHSIGFVKNYIEIDEAERAQEVFKTGYLILRAIEIESRQVDQLGLNNINNIPLFIEQAI